MVPDTTLSLNSKLDSQSVTKIITTFRDVFLRVFLLILPYFYLKHLCIFILHVYNVWTLYVLYKETKILLFKQQSL